MKRNPAGQGIALRNKYLSALIAFSLFFLSVKSQPVTIVVEYPDKASAAVALGAVSGNFTGVSQRYVDSFFNALNSKFAKLLHTHSGLEIVETPVRRFITDVERLRWNSYTSSGGESRIVIILEKQEGKEYQTEDYGKTFAYMGTVGSYVYGGQSTHENNQLAGSLRSDMKDKPWRVWAFNSNADRTKRFANSYTYGRWFEPFWFNPTLGYFTVEDHVANMVDVAGHEHRYFSVNARIDNGLALLMFEGTSFSVTAKHKDFYAAGVEPGPYFHVNMSAQLFLKDLEGNNSQILLENRSGLKMLFGMAGNVPVLDIPATPGSGGQGFHYDGFGHFKPLGSTPKIYGSNQEAINNGKQKGDAYATRNSDGKLIIAIVE